MAYYPPDFVERIHAHQAPAGGALHAAEASSGHAREDPERALALVELEDRIIERALAAPRAQRIARPRSASATTCRNVLDRLAEIGVLTPNGRGYDADDVAIIEAMVRFRAGGYDEALGFTVYDTLRYREALRRWSRRRSRRCSAAWPARSSPTARRRSSPRAPSRCAS